MRIPPITIVAIFLALALSGCPSDKNGPRDVEVELCDGLDEDLDGVTDEGCDLDQDGYCSQDDVVQNAYGQWPPSCAQGPGDCDDQNPKVHPGAQENCDNEDNNCDGQTDENCDKDGDGHCTADRTTLGTPYACPGGGGDCDDSDPDVYPGAQEDCNDVDDNCSGTVDDGCDGDSDGYCDGERTVVGSPAVCPSGGGDCDDQLANVHPGAQKICDGLDNDCDGQVDLDCDGDGDDFCDASLNTVGNPAVCPSGGDDCDDSDPEIHPGAPETCNDQDDNCADGTDEGCDDDQDGYCDQSLTVSDPPPASCPQGPGDCDDQRAEVYPGALEICDDLDQNCDQQADEGCDPDGDGYCDALLTVVGLPAVCPNGPGDCREDDPNVYPGAQEDCNDVDDNCVDGPDEGCDSDGDGYCQEGLNVSDPPPAVCPLGPGDCDDTQAEIYPGALEICNDLDDNCDSTMDEGCDADGDGYCILAVGTPAACPSGDGDCDDSDPLFNPGAPDGCGGDWNCDGQVLSPQFADPVSVRGTEGFGAESDMASDGTDLGVAWIEEDEYNRRAKFVLLDSTGAIAMGPINISAVGQGVEKVAVAWSEAQNAYAVAYTGMDGVRQQRSLWLSFVDRAGVVSAPIYVDQTIRQFIKVVTSNNYVGVFYAQEYDSTRESMMYASYDVQSQTLATPTLTLIDTSIDTEEMSYLCLENSPLHGGTCYMVMGHYRSYEPQPYGYIFLAVYADGIMRTSQTFHGFPDDLSEWYPQLAQLNGALYLMWVNRSTVPPQLRLASLDESSGTTTIVPYTLAQNVEHSLSAGQVIAQEDSTTFGLVYQDRTSLEFQFARYSSATFSLISGPHPLAIGQLEVSNSTQAPFFCNSGTYFLLNDSAHPNFFTLNRIATDGSLDIYEPLVPPPFSSPFNEEQLLYEYDEQSDEYFLLQRDPDDPQVLQAARVRGDGTTIQAPTYHSTLSESCEYFQLQNDGSLVCYEVSEQITDQVGLVHLFDGTNWQISHSMASVPLADHASVHLFLFEARPDGSSVWIVEVVDNNPDGTDHQLVDYTVFDPSGSPVESVTVNEQLAEDGSINYFSAIEGAGHLALVVAYRSIYPRRGHAELTIIDQSDLTPVLQQEPVAFPDHQYASVRNTSYGIGPRTAWAGIFDGAQFVFPFTRRYITSGNIAGQSIVLASPNQSPPTVVTPTFDSMVTDIQLDSPGQYSLFTANLDTAQFSHHYLDAAGTVLSSTPIDYIPASIYNFGSGNLSFMGGGLSQNGRLHRLLLRNAELGRMLSFSATCQ